MISESPDDSIWLEITLAEGLRPWFAGLSLSVDLDRVGAQVNNATFLTRGLTL